MAKLRKIRYCEQELSVYTIMSEEYWGDVEDDEEELETTNEETNG